jgi:hypothetical protein
MVQQEGVGGDEARMFLYLFKQSGRVHHQRVGMLILLLFLYLFTQ